MAQATVSLNPYDPAKEDAADRRAALEAAIAHGDGLDPEQITGRAGTFYSWLRGRDTLRPYRLVVSFGSPNTQGARKMADVTLNLLDNQDDNGTVKAVDAKGFATADSPFTWNNAGPDVVEITPSEDGTQIAVSALAPGDAVLTVTDAGGLTGSVLVHVDAGPVDHLEVAFDSATTQAPATSLGDLGAQSSSGAGGQTQPADSITTPTGAVVEPNPQASGAGSSAANDGLTAAGPVSDTPDSAGNEAGSGTDTLAVQAEEPVPADGEEQPAE
jgi:hypothetical protein